MIALKAEDVKSFTTRLFVREDFDAFLVKEVNITTYNSFSIDGHVKQGYYTEEEQEENLENLKAFLFFSDQREKTSWKLSHCAAAAKGGNGKICRKGRRRDRWKPDPGIVSEHTVRRRENVLYYRNVFKIFHHG